MKVFVNSLPKSGTNLLEKLIRMVGFRHSGRSIASTNIIGRHSVAKSLLHQDHFYGCSVPVGLEVPVSVSVKWLKRTLTIGEGEYLSGHAAYSEQLDYLVRCQGLKMIQIYRDPRAVLLSWAKYVAEDINRWYPYHKFFSGMNLDSRIRFLLFGGEIDGVWYSSFHEVLNRAGGWINSDNVFVVRFEDLIGEQGGGDRQAQVAVIKKIFQHIGYVYSEDDILYVVTNLYGGTHTFRSGKKDAWRKEIDDRLERTIINCLADCVVVRHLGYFSE